MWKPLGEAVSSGKLCAQLDLLYNSFAAVPAYLNILSGSEYCAADLVHFGGLP